MSKRGSSKEGFAKSKKHIHGEQSHPTFFKKKSRKGDDIEYVSFSHSKEIILNNGQKIIADEIDNINPSERGSGRKSHVIPIVYKGKRSSLGKSTSEYSLTSNAKKRVDYIFMNAPRENAPSKKRKK